MLVFGLLVVSAIRVFGTLYNPASRHALIQKHTGLFIWIGWALVFMGAALQLVDGISG